ncbi:MAG TPA: prolyl oligopeptidase family serine peptidase [Myxococcota bacterium]|nr:prolyl oligopeptidase family serine peptidase [Myxococcota bacterium]
MPACACTRSRPAGAPCSTCASRRETAPRCCACARGSTARSTRCSIRDASTAALAWHPDGRSFYYARVPEGNEGARRDAGIRLYRHVLGREAARDEIVFAPGVGGARDVPEFAYPRLHLPRDSRHAYAVVRAGARRDIAVHVTAQRDLADGRPRWRKLAGFDDQALAIEGWRNDLYVLSRRDAPRHRVLRVRATDRDLAAARVVVPEGEVVLQSMALARDALYLRTMLGGVDRLERVPIGLLGTKAPQFVRIPFDTAILELVADPREPGAILRLEGWMEPPRVVQVEARGGELRDTHLQPPSPADFSAMDEVRLYAPSHDGTRIPVTLVYRKSTRLTGENPTLLSVFGAYGAARAPSFDPARLAWLERGGVLAVAHVRGGGEYGQEWHEAGRRAAKINTILDLVAVSEYLVSYGFTSPRRLAIRGTGAGGIAVGGALVRRPELYAAVVARSPLMDMLRYEAMAGGPPAVPEFGSAASPEGARDLQVISAYHHVRDGVAYPATLLTARLDDPLVAPWQAGKMAARLQAATVRGAPVLLRVDDGAGAARARREEELADVYSFLLWRLGDPQFQPPLVYVDPPPMLPPVDRRGAPAENRREEGTIE